MFQLAAPHDLTEAETDQFLLLFDQKPRAEQRRLIVRVFADRALLIDAAKEAAAVSWDRLRVQELLRDAVEIVERPGEEG